MRCDPNHRWKAVQAALLDGAIPTDSLVRRVYNVMSGKETDNNIMYAVNLIEEQPDRDAIVAYLLSGATTEEISKSLWIHPVGVVDIFSELWLDTSVFRDKLEHLRYSEYYLDHVCPKDDERNQSLIRQGISQGPKALDLWWKRARDTVTIERGDLTDTILRIAFVNAMAAKEVSVTSPVAREAHKWVKTALDAVESRDAQHKMYDDNLDALLVLEKHVESQVPENLGISSDDIMH